MIYIYRNSSRVDFSSLLLDQKVKSTINLVHYSVLISTYKIVRKMVLLYSYDICSLFSVLLSLILVPPMIIGLGGMNKGHRYPFKNFRGTPQRLYCSPTVYSSSESRPTSPPLLSYIPFLVSGLVSLESLPDGVPRPGLRLDVLSQELNTTVLSWKYKVAP